MLYTNEETDNNIFLWIYIEDTRWRDFTVGVFYSPNWLGKKKLIENIFLCNSFVNSLWYTTR